MASFGCLFKLYFCVCICFISIVSGFYTRSTQSSYSIQKCKTSFMCPPFCMKSRDGCYVCDCGEKMVNQMKSMMNGMKNDYKPLYQMGSEMTLNGGKTGSSMNYGTAGVYGGMMMPHLSPYNNIHQFNGGLSGQFGGMGGQYSNKQSNYMISNYLEPNFKEFYRPFQGIIPGKCSLMDFTCHPDCWKTDVYTGCFKCQCQKENTQSTIPPTTSESTVTTVTRPTITTQKSTTAHRTTLPLTSTYSDTSATKTSTTTLESTSIFTTTSTGTTLIPTTTTPSTTSETNPSGTTSTILKTSTTDTTLLSTYTPSTITATTTPELTKTGVANTEPMTLNKDMETKTTKWATKNSVASVMKPSDGTTTITPSSPDMASASSKTICPPVTERCPENCLLIDPLTFCSVCFCVNTQPDTTTTKMTTRTSTPEQVCNGLSPLCPGKCVTLDENWCAKCSCPLETSTTTSVNRLAGEKDDTDFVTSQPIENSKFKENGRSSEVTTCKPVPKYCPEYCLVLNDNWCPVCICEEAITSRN